MDLDKNTRSVFLLKYNLTLCIKGRRNIIEESISENLKKLFIDISSKYGVTLISWHYEVDYIYLSFKAKPNTEISKMINAYKSASSRKIKNTFPKLRELLWNEFFWSRSYCLTTFGCDSLEIVNKYIESQVKL
ncbi:IS200/IS605 family transposase [Clostridioides difficile]|uniref:IS200/IS605 family transposase n=1 Tax=Clostridioides difficile TaxID=1496 RepID=UPI0010343E8F|nr:IS200/IS605 family transposase [Clostridioides difficile]MDM9944131.1 IS200/IS605 family transposase [Clostridioides difficile]